MRLIRANIICVGGLPSLTFYGSREYFPRTKRDGFDEAKREGCFYLLAVTIGGFARGEDVGAYFLFGYAFGVDDVCVVFASEEEREDLC